MRDAVRVPPPLPEDLVGRLAYLLHCSRRGNQARYIDAKVMPYMREWASEVLADADRFGVRLTLSAEAAEDAAT